MNICVFLSLILYMLSQVQKIFRNSFSSNINLNNVQICANIFDIKKYFHAEAIFFVYCRKSCNISKKTYVGFFSYSFYFRLYKKTVNTSERFQTTRTHKCLKRALKWNTVVCT